ncbi:MAG: hypothetical protein AB7O32_07105 [Vicinamibacterales bacterium]
MDVVEGLREEATLPHLASCASCREELQMARDALAEIQDVAVPEPPPFALEQLSARVRAAVAAERSAPRLRVWRGWRLALPALVLAGAFAMGVRIWPPAGFGLPANVSGPLPSAPLTAAASRRDAGTPGATVPGGANNGANGRAIDLADARDTSPDTTAVDAPSGDDPSTSWMLDLADAVSDGGSSAGMSDGWGSVPVPSGLADAAVGSLSSDEQQELARLIREALGSAGA